VSRIFVRKIEGELKNGTGLKPTCLAVVVAVIVAEVIWLRDFHPTPSAPSLAADCDNNNNNGGRREAG
jgi:hypothetical protein